MPLPLYQVDAFTDRPFAGNPAAIVLLEHDPDDDAWMQAVATEMNLSETAFVTPLAEAGAFGLRWFTPAAEVELCGHATLASAHLLWELGRVSADRPIAFHTRFRGVLTCTRDGAGRVVMDFPADPTEPRDTPAGLLEALGVRSAIAVSRSSYDWIVELATESAVAALEPDFAALKQFEARGVCVTARARPGRSYDIASRFFAPRLRVAEDPVTGSLHCVLGPYWADRLGKNSIAAYQASPRGGRLSVTVDGDRVRLAGHAVTVSRGELLA